MAAFNKNNRGEVIVPGDTTLHIFDPDFRRLNPAAPKFYESAFARGWKDPLVMLTVFSIVAFIATAVATHHM